jgi:hypothetical protein
VEEKQNCIQEYDMFNTDITKSYPSEDHKLTRNGYFIKLLSDQLKGKK